MKKIGMVLCWSIVLVAPIGCGGEETTVDTTPEVEQPTPENDDMQAEAAAGGPTDP